jgi:hypothetical protein
MRKIRNFTNPTDARTAQQLTTQIATFETNVDAEVTDLRQKKLELSVIATAASKEQTVSHTDPPGTTVLVPGSLDLAPGESLGVDTKSASLTVRLAAPSAKNAGQIAVLVKRDAANTVTLDPNGAALINNAPTLALTAVGLYFILSDGEGYWASNG